LSSLVEGRLGAPAAYLLPSNRRGASSEHPLTRLSAATRARAAAAGFDARAALARDAARFRRAPGLVWGLAPESLPEVLVVGRIIDFVGCHALERFVGIPSYPWPLPPSIDGLLRGSGTIVSQETVTCFGQVVHASLFGVIFTGFLEDARPAGPGHDPLVPSEWSVLRSHLAPRRRVCPPEPELFTWSSAFNTARDLWPGVSGQEQLLRLDPSQQGAIANQFLGYGLEALAAESDSQAIRLIAQRLIEMCDWGLLDLNLTSRPYSVIQEQTGLDRDASSVLLPEEHGLAYLRPEAPSSADRPTDKQPAQKGTILVPLQWIAGAMQREIVALVHLVRLASLARDDSFGKLAGHVFGFSRELRARTEISLFDVAVARADALAARFLDEALRYDNRVYGLQVQRDSHCRAIERKAHPVRPGSEPDRPTRR
jgi:hypothetical protein